MAPKGEEIRVTDYEKVTYFEEKASGLKAIIAIHNTNLGPACGGIRLLPYASKDEALTDVLRLSKGMSYKSALAGIGFGGGKSVILCDPTKKTKELFHAFGGCVESLGGHYIAAKDMNIDSSDLMAVKKTTAHVLGIEGVPGSSGDPSPVTARGVFRAFEAAAEELGAKNLSGMKVAVQGIGHVGYALCEFLKKAGADIWVTDTDTGRLRVAQENLGAKTVSGDAIYDIACDIFSPNARGAVLNDDTLKRLKCRAIVGAANNQLLTPQHGFRLHEKGILYAPDYAVNAGGIINIFVELGGYNPQKAYQMADGIFDTIKEIFKRSKEKNTAPFIIADELAEERIYGKR